MSSNEARQDLRFGSQVHKARKVPMDGSTEQQAVLAGQLRKLRSLEDPANTSPTAAVYREMCARADSAALGGGRERGPWMGAGTRNGAS